MKSQILYNQKGHQWVVLGRDMHRQSNVIDTNEFVIMNRNDAILLDPGGIEIFPQVLSELTRYIEADSIKVIVASHQDPDIASSIAMWLDLCPEVKIYCPWLWTGFISHFGMGTKMELHGIPDKGMKIKFSNTGAGVYAVPAHFCHSSGNFSFHDPTSNILFSGDIGAALLPSHESPLFVEDFEDHIRYMEGFHKRWMPSSAALRDWVKRVRMINPDMICPQHGSLFQGENVKKFLDWLETLEVGWWDSAKADDELKESLLDE